MSPRRREPNPRTKRAVSRWTARVIPPLLAGAVGYCTYVLVSRLCIDYLLHTHHDTGAATAILVIYSFLLIAWITTFARLWYLINFHPPYLPLGPDAPIKQKLPIGRMKSGSYDDYISYAASEKRHNDPDAPGLEDFYTKDVFVSDLDGRPKWCRHCANWKPDRTHHCSDVGRCIYKMDHFCPWVGGPVGENNFKFFIQFTAYTASTCVHLLVVMAVHLAKQISRAGEHYDAQFIVVIALSGFLGMFTTSMCITSSRMACQNLTQIERLDAKTRSQSLAVYKPSHITNTLPPNPTYHEISYPLQRHDPADSREATASHTDSHAEQPQPDSLAPQPETTAPGDPSIDGQADSRLEIPHSDHANRDARATRTFIVLMTQPGDNPWDLGSSYRNWKAVMGKDMIDWFLPFRHSPCCKHQSDLSYFEYGPVIDKLKASAGLISPDQKPSVPASRSSFFRRGSGRDDGNSVSMEKPIRVLRFLGS